MLRSSSKNKENLNSKERRTSSLQRRRSILSILSSSSSIQKPERGRSQNRIITNNDIDINKVITACGSGNSTMNVDIQQNNLSSEQPQSSINPDHLSHENGIEDGIEQSDSESSEGNRSLSTTSHDNVWSFFIHVADDTYQCRLCSNTYKAYNRVDANLRKHIGKTHKMEQYLFKSQKSNNYVKKKSISPEQKKKLHNAAIECIIKDGRPFGDFRREGMKKFLSVAIPGYVGPHRKTVAARLRLLYNKYRKELKCILMKLNDISLTSDIWQNSRQSYFIVLTAHFYEKDYKYTSLVIGFRQFMGPHDAVQIRRYINYEIDRLEIRYKLRSITTDNGANIKSATQNNGFGVRIGCYCHNINLIVSQGLGLWKKKSVLRKMWLNGTTSPDEEEEEPMICSEEIQITEGMVELDTLNTNVLLEEDATSEEESINEDSSDEENFSSEEQEQQRAHEKLNDIVDEQIFEDRITNDTPPDKIIFGIHLLLCRIRCLVILIRKCYLINEYVRRQAKGNKTIQSGELVVDFRIRWNTTCVMLTKFIEHRHIIVEITNTPEKITNLKRSKCDHLMSLTLRPQHWEWIITLKRILDPFHSSTNALSGRNYETLAPGKVIIFALKNFLSTRNVYHHLENILKSRLLEKYTLYFEVKVTQEQSCLALVAAFLCPYAKQYLTVTELKKAEITLIQEYEILRSAKLIPSSTTNNITDSSNNAEQSMKSSKGHMEKSIDYLLKICLVDKPPVHKTTKKRTEWTIQQELGYYATTGTPKQNFQSYWNLNQDKMPILASLVRRFCLSPATSVASESSFSCANYIQRKQRSSLSSTNLCYTMVLRDADVVKRLSQMY